MPAQTSLARESVGDRIPWRPAADAAGLRDGGECQAAIRSSRTMAPRSRGAVVRRWRRCCSGETLTTTRRGGGCMRLSHDPPSAGPRLLLRSSGGPECATFAGLRRRRKGVRAARGVIRGRSGRRREGWSRGADASPGFGSRVAEGSAAFRGAAVGFARSDDGQRDADRAPPLFRAGADPAPEASGAPLHGASRWISGPSRLTPLFLS